MPVYSEHAIAAYFPHIFRAYFKLDRSAYFGKNLRYKLACLTNVASVIWAVLTYIWFTVEIPRAL